MTGGGERAKIARMRKTQSSRTVVLFALCANLFIAVVKFIVAFITASSAMLAEAIHSVADTMNQVLLLVGMRSGRRRPDDLHPFGFSSELYFWSFIVAIILFTLGAVFAIYEGVHKLMHPQAIENINYAFIVLAVAIVAEGAAFYRAFKKVNRERGDSSIVTYLRKTKKSELIVVFLEDLAALTGLGIALVLIFIQHQTGILIFDGIASIVIGFILAVVALFLGNETRSLLIGESADSSLVKSVVEIFEGEESINHLIQIKSLQLGPDDILIAVKAEFDHRLNAVEISNLINGLEEDIRRRYPDVKKIFVEPDLYSRRF